MRQYFYEELNDGEMIDIDRVREITEAAGMSQKRQKARDENDNHREGKRIEE